MITDETLESVEACIFGNDLVAQARLENSLVPNVVVKCIEAVEHNGMSLFTGLFCLLEIDYSDACFLFQVSSLRESIGRREACHQ